MQSIRNIIRKMLAESMLQEGDSIMVRNVPHEEELEGVLDICHFVVKQISRKLLGELGLSEDELKNIQGFMSHFSPDGDSAFDDTGVMNFYCVDWPERTHEKIIGFIKWILSENNITVGEVTSEKYGEKFSQERMKELELNPEDTRVYRIPIVSNQHEANHPPSIHLSTSTWAKLMEDVLGFESMHDDINVDDLARKIQIARGTLASKTEIPDQSHFTQKGNVYTSQKGKEYMMQLMGVLESLVEWCVEGGFTTLYIA